MGFETYLRINCFLVFSFQFFPFSFPTCTYLRLRHHRNTEKLLQCYRPTSHSNPWTPFPVLHPGTLCAQSTGKQRDSPSGRRKFISQIGISVSNSHWHGKLCICICWLPRRREYWCPDWKPHWQRTWAASPELSLLYSALGSSGLAADTPEQLVAAAVWNPWTVTMHWPSTLHGRALTYSAPGHRCNITDDISNAKEGQIFNRGTNTCLTANALQSRAQNRYLCDKNFTTWKPASKKSASCTVWHLDFQPSWRAISSNTSL